MEDGEYLSPQDKELLKGLKQKLLLLKTEHKDFAARKSKLSPEDRERWRKNATETNEVSVAIKELRRKNILEAGK